MNLATETFARLDAISRTRALTNAESVSLEKAIRSIDADRQREDCAAAVQALAEKAAGLARIPLRDLMSNSRFRAHTRPRIAVYLAAVEAGISTPQIGAAFGRDHSTIIYGVASARKKRVSDPAFRALCDRLSA